MEFNSLETEDYKNNVQMKIDATSTLYAVSVKVNYYTWKIFCSCWQGRQLLSLPVCFHIQQSPSNKGPAIKGNNLPPLGANYFSLE